MKKTTLLICLLAILPFFFQPANACDRSSISYTGVTSGPGGTLDLHLTLCVGGGILGSDRGADGNTGRFIFAFSSALPGFTVNSWTPSPGPTSDTTGTLYPGTNVGPQPAFNAAQAIYFNSGANWYACVNNTAACGLPHTDCVDMIFNVNFMPDSMRVYGIEGGDNFFDGCYPNSTMVTDFIIYPVTWGDFEVKTGDQGVTVRWTTLQEEDNRLFEILRAGEEGVFSKIGEVAAAGFSRQAQSYSYLDNRPLPGVNYYKVRQVDIDGQSTQTESREARFTPESGISWSGVFPNPADAQVNVMFTLSEQANYSLELLDIHGRLISRRTGHSEAGIASETLEVDTYPAGLYLLRLETPVGTLVKKLVIE